MHTPGRIVNQPVIQTCDWCERPARHGFGPATGATHHICSVHAAAPRLLEALEEARTILEQDYLEGDLVTLHDDVDAAIAEAKGE